MIMQWYNGLLIAEKLKYLLLLFGAVCIAAFSSISMYYGALSLSTSLEREALSTANYLGQRSVAALRFDNPSFIAETINSIENQGFRSICVYNRAGIMVAHHQDTRACVKPSRSADGMFHTISHRHAGVFTVVRNIVVDGELVGAVSLQQKSSAMEQYLWDQLQVIAVVAIISLLIGYVVASYLQRILSRPIVDMARSAQNIARMESGEQSLMKHNRSDEIGQVVQAFNRALTFMQGEVEEMRGQHRGAIEANKRILDRFDHLSSDFSEVAGAMMVYSEMVTSRVYGPMTTDYVPYQRDLIEALQKFHIKIESLRKLSDIYAHAIGVLPQRLCLSDFIQSVVAHYQAKIPVAKIDSINTDALCSHVYLHVHMEAWDELFRIIAHLMQSMTGVVAFSPVILFNFQLSSHTLEIALGESAAGVRVVNPALEDLIRMLNASVVDDEEEIAYKKHSIEDPESADEFLSEEGLRREDVAFILDSMNYIAGANQICVEHTFHERRFTIRLHLNEVCKHVDDALTHNVPAL